MAVVLANEHDLVRRALRSILHDHQELVVVGEARGPEAVAHTVRDRRPDVVVMDLPSGRSASEQIAALDPAGTGPAVVVTTFERSRELARRLFDAGARGYVLTHQADEELVAAVLAAANGGRFLSPAVASAHS